VSRTPKKHHFGLNLFQQTYKKDDNLLICDSASARKNLPDTASKGPARHSVNLPILSAGTPKKQGTAHIHCHRIANK
jgi:hypothetical protein